VRDDLTAYRGGTLPDLAGPGMRLLFVGYNPGLRSVAVQAPFSLRSNRFWPALFAAGILDRDVVARDGLRDDRIAGIRLPRGGHRGRNRRAAAPGGLAPAPLSRGGRGPPRSGTRRRGTC
jgi:hypothetical protein